MSETTESLDTTTDPSESAGRHRAATKGADRRGEGLSGMVLTDLKALAGQLGIKGTSGMRKGDLVAAIAARQNGARRIATRDVPGPATAAGRARASRPAPRRTGRAGAPRSARPSGTGVRGVERAAAADRTGRTARPDTASMHGRRAARQRPATADRPATPRAGDSPGGDDRREHG